MANAPTPDHRANLAPAMAVGNHEWPHATFLSGRRAATVTITIGLFSNVQCSNDDLAMRESRSLADVAFELEEIRASDGACSLMMQKVGVGLVVTSYGMLMFTSLAGPAYMRAHPQLKTRMLAEYAAPWPVALGCALGVVGIALALIPIRRGERWAMWTSLATLMVLLIPRITADPRCLVVLDPHQHGCHSFLLAIVLGVVGLVLARFGS